MHYLDHAATSPVLPEVMDAMGPYFTEHFGNPSSVHAYGRRARQGVEDARDQVATAVGASPSEIVFTSGGTEADNIALSGAAHKLRGNGNHLVTTAFEHHAVLDTVGHLGRTGFDTTVVPVGPDGLVDPDRVADAVTARTSVVSVMTVNNEVGTVQDVAAIVEAVKGANPRTLVHTDAVQALPHIPVALGRWGVDLAAFSAHKLGGPKGVGALFVRSGVPVSPIVHGGGQEHGLRSGTLNAAGIVGFGAAAEVAAKEVHEKAERLLKLRTKLLEGIRDVIPDVVVNGDLERRVAGNLHVSIPGTKGEILLLLLDGAGVACSTGSACQSGAVDPSHVLLAMGVSNEMAEGSLRFSLGRSTTEGDIDSALDALPDVVERARKVS